MNIWLLLLGAVGVALGLSSMNQTESSDIPFGSPVPGDVPSPPGGADGYDPSLNDPGMGEIIEGRRSGLGELGQVNTGLAAGRRIRYGAHVRSGPAWVAGQYGGDLNGFRSRLSGSFTVVRVWQTNSIVLSGGKNLFAELRLKHAWSNGSQLVYFVANCARQSGFVLDQGSGGYGFMNYG